MCLRIYSREELTRCWRLIYMSAGKKWRVPIHIDRENVVEDMPRLPLLIWVQNIRSIWRYGEVDCGDGATASRPMNKTWRRAAYSAQSIILLATERTAPLLKFSSWKDFI